MLLDKLWEDFEKKVIPKEANADQRFAMKTAFYSGAHVMIQAVKTVGDNDDITPEEAAKIMVLVETELNTFVNEVVELAKKEKGAAKQE